MPTPVSPVISTLDSVFLITSANPRTSFMALLSAMISFFSTFCFSHFSLPRIYRVKEFISSSLTALVTTRKSVPFSSNTGTPVTAIRFTSRISCSTEIGRFSLRVSKHTEGRKIPSPSRSATFLPKTSCRFIFTIFS